MEHIRCEVDDRILTITLNRPERLNAYTDTMRGELIEAFDRADADDEVRAVIVTGEGRAFCAGADLEAGGSTFESADATEPPRDGGGTVVLRIFESTKPVIAAINGPAVGVGITMTLPMDVRLAADDARMGFVFTRRGIVPEACSSWFLPRIVSVYAFRRSGRFRVIVRMRSSTSQRICSMRLLVRGLDCRGARLAVPACSAGHRCAATVAKRPAHRRCRSSTASRAKPSTVLPRCRSSTASRATSESSPTSRARFRWKPAPGRRSTVRRSSS